MSKTLAVFIVATLTATASALGQTAVPDLRGTSKGKSVARRTVVFQDLRRQHSRRLASLASQTRSLPRVCRLCR